LVCDDGIGCSFKFLLKVGVEKSIVNAPHSSVCRVKTQTMQKVKLSVICNP
jgi:hypothetical protein